MMVHTDNYIRMKFEEAYRWNYADAKLQYIKSVQGYLDPYEQRCYTMWNLALDQSLKPKKEPREFKVKYHIKSNPMIYVDSTEDYNKLGEYIGIGSSEIVPIVKVTEFENQFSKFDCFGAWFECPSNIYNGGYCTTWIFIVFDTIDEINQYKVSLEDEKTRILQNRGVQYFNELDDH